MCGTPPPREGGQNFFPKTSTQPATHLIFWGFSGFSVKKGQKKIKNGPKMVQKWSKNGPKMVKNGQNCPKIGEIVEGFSPRLSLLFGIPASVFLFPQGYIPAPPAGLGAVPGGPPGPLAWGPGQAGPGGGRVLGVGGT